MPNSIDLPLHLFQVLEQEYISLYGQLEQETVIKLEGRPVSSRLDWDFHKGHIKDWEKFKIYLENRNLNLPSKLQDFMIRLKLYQATKKGKENLTNQPTHEDKGNLTNQPAEEDKENPTNQLTGKEKKDLTKQLTEEDALEALNQLLGESFYSQYEFGNLTLSKTTQKLVELYPKENPLQAMSLEELRHINRFLLEDIFSEHLESVRDIRLAAIYQRRHDKKPTALCFSGGGIRSGTFALGLLQGMARHNLLKQFDYLSTVSGGGYIGGWLTAWIHRHRPPDKGLEGVTHDLTNATPPSKIDPDPASIQHLREYSNFLTPKAGLMSADTWTFIAIYFRNLLLNWSVLIPLLLALLLIPRLSVAAVLAKPPGSIPRYLILSLGFICASWAIAYIDFSRPGLRTRLIEANPRWKERMGQRGFLKYCLVPLIVAAVSLTTYLAWTPHIKVWWHFLLAGLGASWLGVLLSSIILRTWWKRAAITLGTWRESRFITPLLLIIAGGAGGLIARAATEPISRNLVRLKADDYWSAEVYASYAVPVFLLMFMLALTVFAGISSHFLSKITEEEREWWARFSAWAMISAIAWSVFSTLVIFGPLVLLASPKLVSAVGGISGLVGLLFGWSGKTPATSEQIAQGGWKASLSSKLLPLLAILFLAVFVAALSLLTSKMTKPLSQAVDRVGREHLRRPDGTLPPSDWVVNLWAPVEQKSSNTSEPLTVEFSNTKVGEFIPSWRDSEQTPQHRSSIEHLRSIHYPPWWFFTGLTILLFGIGILMSRVINLNLFSLHNSYRSRLIRGFLAASRDKLMRRPNPFTGFDPADNVSMHELRPALLHEVDFKDIDGFANELKNGGAALKPNLPPTTPSGFLYTKLSDKGKAAVDSYASGVSLAQTHRVDLMEDLNRILEDDQIQLETETGFVRPPAPAAPPPSELQVYHIHRNRHSLELTFSTFIEASNYPPHRLLHVVNTTLNLVGGDNLAWQQRKAESFTVSPLHCGSYRVGYRKSMDYGGDDGISLGTAMTISGAAASSNMGYYTTSPVLSMVLTLFNVRLGWWLGNPGPAGGQPPLFARWFADRSAKASKKIYRRMSPTFSVMPLINEAFGLTDDRSKYVYLTDGGHFENLALYEMVLRRCHLIVVSDGAADPKYEFNDLANAVRKVRIDLGIHIEFPDVPIYRRAPDKPGEGGCYWAIGWIRYSDIDRRQDGRKAKDGILIYIKPAIYEDEPEDVMHYKRTHPTFPHETTIDQFFDEPQFESYRALGSYIMTRMCGSHSGRLNLSQFIANVTKNFYRIAPQVKDKYREFLIR